MVGVRYFLTINFNSFCEICLSIYDRKFVLFCIVKFEKYFFKIWMMVIIFIYICLGGGGIGVFLLFIVIMIIFLGVFLIVVVELIIYGLNRLEINFFLKFFRVDFRFFSVFIVFIIFDSILFSDVNFS